MEKPSPQVHSKAIGCAFIVGGLFLYFVLSYFFISLIYGEDTGHLTSLGASSGAGAMIRAFLGSPLYFIFYPLLYSIIRKRKADVGLNELHTMITSAAAAAVVLCILIWIL